MIPGESMDICSMVRRITKDIHLRGARKISMLYLRNWKECTAPKKIKMEMKRKRGEKNKPPGPLMGYGKGGTGFGTCRTGKPRYAHSLDVMHITKNVCESLLRTLLN